MTHSNLARFQTQVSEKKEEILCFADLMKKTKTVDKKNY